MSAVRIYANAGDYIKVTSSTPLIVMMRNDSQHQNFLIEGAANFYGGFFNHFPALIQVPSKGFWNISFRWHRMPQEHVDFSVELFKETVDEYLDK